MRQANEVTERYLAIADEIEASLWKELIDRWYPTAYDAAGGFHQSFNRAWEKTKDPTRFIVFQSRLTWVAASIAEAYPSRREEFTRYAEHGLSFLLDHMRHPVSGGFYWWIDLDGKRVSAVQGDPTGNIPDYIRNYGVSFALYAMAAVARLGSARALEACQETFAYLERTSHDDVFGGYFELVDPNGKVVTEPDEQTAGMEMDEIANPFGKKTHNLQLHLVEAFAELHRVWPDAQLNKRLRELLDVMTKSFILPQGCSCSLLNRDLTPATHRCSYGHDIEGAHLILDASRHVEGYDVAAVVTRLVDFVLDEGWDTAHGGIYNHGIPGERVVNTTKTWWGQSEALLGLAAILQLTGDPAGRYEKALTELWHWISTKQIDSELGGWFGDLTPGGKILDGGVKGHAWKALYHETRGLMGTARILRSLARG